jgi:phage baseplate assembly protein W
MTDMTYREIDLPFHFDGQGQVAFSENRPEQIANRLVGLIGTIPTERAMRSSYGTNASSTLFNHTLNLGNDITASIRGAISQWEPSITVKTVTAVEDFATPSAVNIKVDFSLREGGTVKSYSATITTGGEVREVVEIV